MTLTYVLALMGILSPFLLIFFVWDRKRVTRRVAAIERQIGVVVPFWRGIQAVAIDQLTHDHKLRVDELLQRLRNDPHYQMTEADRDELLAAMKEVQQGDDPLISDDERDLAAIFPVIMKQVQKEDEDRSPIRAVQLVGIKEVTEKK